VQEVGIFPPPVQPDLPVWVTSSGRRETFQKAVLTHLLRQGAGELADNIAAYRAALAGRPGHVRNVGPELGEQYDKGISND
jgi:hypothetical protein